MAGGLIRGMSFVQDYMKPPTGLERMPSMVQERPQPLLPPKPADMTHKYTVVLDLDETLVYARDGPLLLRPHTKALLALVGKHCEVVVWTAGDRDYAQAIIRAVDTDRVVSHCVYRHKKWFKKDYTKDLTLLGRDMDDILIIENTADCVRCNPENSIIVEDYEGGEGVDKTMVSLMKVLEQLCDSGLPVSTFLKSCSLLTRQVVRYGKRRIPILYLSASRSNDGKKVVKGNRDAAAADNQPDHDSDDGSAATDPATPPKSPLPPPPPRRVSRITRRRLLEQATPPVLAEEPPLKRAKES